MTMLRCVSVAVLAMSVLASVASAQTTTKYAVFVSHSGEDTVGKQLAYAVREELRKSAGYSAGSERESPWEIGLVSLDPDRSSGQPGNWSAVAVTFTMRNLLPYKAGSPQTWLPIFLSSGIHIVGSSRVEEKARSLVAELDRLVGEYLAAVK